MLLTKTDRLLTVYSFILLTAIGYRTWGLCTLSFLTYLVYVPASVFALSTAPFVLRILGKDRKGVLWSAWGCSILFLLLKPFVFSWPHQRGTHSLRIVTQNIQGYDTDLVAFSRELRALNPDFVFLQEVWTLKQLNAIQKALPGYHFLMSEYDTTMGEYLEDGCFLACKTNWSFERLNSPKRTVMAMVSNGQTKVLLVSLHGIKRYHYDLSSVLGTFDDQLEQARRLRDCWPGEPVSKIIAGDFNSPNSGPGYKVLALGNRDAFFSAGNGFGYTYPSKNPFMRIDHVLTTPDIKTESCTTSDLGSDHLSLVCEMELPGMPSTTR